MARLTRNRARATLACPAAAAGCEAEPEPPPLAYQTRDSAGIAVAVNSASPPTRSGQATWTATGGSTHRA